MARLSVLVVLGVSLGAAACGGGESSSSSDVTDGGIVTLSDGAVGISLPDGGISITPNTDAGSATCGDGICRSGETCLTCPDDCGECAACTGAPSCSVGVALPASTTTIPFANLSTKYDGGAADNCGGAQLRMRISRIDVGLQGQEVWLPTGTLDGPSQSYYCLMQASDGLVVNTEDGGTGGTMEVVLTPPTAQIADNSGDDLPVASSIFWGQAGPRLTQGNLTITYSCFRQASTNTTAEAWAAILDAGASAAGGLANDGPYGWAFGAGSVGLSVASAIAAAAEQEGDVHLFDETVTIDSSWYLDLTNGTSWAFTEGGGNQAFDYPWSLTVTSEAWGCADALPTPAR